MVDKKAQTKNTKKMGIIALLVLCVVFVLAITITDVLPIGTTAENLSIEIEYNFSDTNVNQIKFNFNGTNTTLYDDSVVLFMNFDNRSALGENDTHVTDLSKYGNNGTVIGGVNIFWTPDGKYGGAFNWTPTFGSSINVDDSDSLDLEEFATISAWVNPESFVDTPRILSKSSAYSFYVTTGGFLGVELQGLSGGAVQSLTKINLNEWSHVALVYNSTHILIYINGTLDKTEAQTGNITITATDLVIGTEGGNRWKGRLDNIIISNESSSSAKISELYISAITKYDEDDWSFYTNQTLESLESYNYSLCIDNSTEEVCSDTRTITNVPKTATVTSNFSNQIGNIRSDFYGTQAFNDDFYSEGLLFDNSCAREVPNNFTLQREKFLDANFKVLRWEIDISIIDPDFSISTNYDEAIEIVEWASDNNVTVNIIVLGTPEWLANKTSGYCTSNWKSCTSTNNTKFGLAVVAAIDNITNNGIHSDLIQIEVWNEPYGSQWLNNLSQDNQIKATEYVKMYNSTYDAVKSAYPNMKVGGADSLFSADTSINLTTTFISNLTNASGFSKWDMIHLHQYDFGIFDLENAVPQLLAICDTYGANCSHIYLSEWNLDVSYDFFRTQRNAMDVATSYSYILNNFPSNFTYGLWKFSSDSTTNNSCDVFFNLSITNSFTGETYPGYNVTKALSISHSGGSTVYNSTTTQSAVKTISSMNGNEFYITVINTDTEARNITVDTDGILTKLFNLETGEEFSSDTGVFTVGVMDSFEILYLGYQGIEGGLVARLNLNENSGTTAHDVSGNSNDGIITGALWFTDGILITLTAVTDYTINAATGLFTIANTDYTWAELLVTWNYIISNADYTVAGDAAEALGEYGDWFDIIVIVGIAGVILTLIFFAFSGNGGKQEVGGSY